MSCTGLNPNIGASLKKWIKNWCFCVLYWSESQHWCQSKEVDKKLMFLCHVQVRIPGTAPVGRDGKAEQDSGRSGFPVGCNVAASEPAHPPPGAVCCRAASFHTQSEAQAVWCSGYGSVEGWRHLWGMNSSMWWSHSVTVILVYWVSDSNSQVRKFFIPSKENVAATHKEQRQCTYVKD